MGPISLSSGELMIWMYLGLVAIFVAAFLMIFVSAIVGLGIARCLYATASWCTKRIHDLYVSRHIHTRVTAAMRKAA